MSKKPKTPGAIQAWFKEIDAARRVKAVCKPCWEIKYCPYGPLVEDFPLAEPNDPTGCRIFGHECPVFSVAEPFSETKELRNISRSIPRPVQFRVLKRDNQICRLCNQPVLADDVHFDHIIPYSKGGSSDESNVQLLCGSCNRKKSDKFEQSHLVRSFADHIAEPVSVKTLEALLFLTEVLHDFYSSEGNVPDSDDMARLLNNGVRTSAEENAAIAVQDLHDFFTKKRPREVNPKIYRALGFRWGFADKKLHRLKLAAQFHDVLPQDLLDAEVSLLERLGWRNVALSSAAKAKWLRT